MSEQRHTISELVDMARNEMIRLQYSHFTVENYSKVWRNLLKYAAEKGVAYFSEEFGEQFLRDHYKYEHGYLEREHRIVQPPRMVRVLGHYQLHGVIMHERLNSKKMQPPEIFAPVMPDFSKYLAELGLKEGSVDVVTRNIVRFLEFLSVNQITRLDLVTEAHITGFAATLFRYCSETIVSYFGSMRHFFRFLHQKGYHQKDLSIAVPRHLSRQTRSIPFIWSKEDVEKLLAAVDRANPIGKRNYAVLLLVTKLGLRDSDVQNLKLGDLKWERNYIEIVQVKTGKNVTLPLLDDVGLAIIDYLKYGRPVSECPHVFLKHVPPYDRMHDFTSIVYKYMNLAGISVKNGTPHGLHSLRHTMASRLLERDVPLSTISSILGHADLNSASVYLSIDMNNLLKCALDPEEVFVSENS
jgi:site-specific recombinase XerD